MEVAQRFSEMGKRRPSPVLNKSCDGWLSGGLGFFYRIRYLDVSDEARLRCRIADESLSLFVLPGVVATVNMAQINPLSSRRKKQN